MYFFLFLLHFLFDRLYIFAYILIVNKFQQSKIIYIYAARSDIRLY